MINDQTKTKRERQKEFQQAYDQLGFSKDLLGDEVIVSVGEDDKIRVLIRIKTSADEFTIKRLTFDTQSQLERLFPAVMKGMK